MGKKTGESGGISPVRCRELSEDEFFCHDLILEIVGVKAVDATILGLELWIHEESNSATCRFRQKNVMRVVVSQPIHFPCAKEVFADRLHFRIIEPLATLLFQDYFTYIGRIDRNPAVTGSVELSPAMLRLGDVTALAQALVTTRRIGHPVSY